MIDNMGGLDTFDVGYAAAKAECTAELSATQQKLEAEIKAHGATITREAQLSLRLEAAEAKSKPVPEGWKLVPKEPTDKMLRAAYDSAKDGAYFTHGMIYEAMLAAAPQPETDRGSNE